MVQLAMVFDLSTLGTGDNDRCDTMCEVYMKTSLTLSQISLFIIYLYLWIRMKCYFYKFERMNAGAKTPCIRHMIWVCFVFFIFFASFVSMYTLIPRGGYKCRSNGCTYNKDEAESILDSLLNNTASVASENTSNIII